MKINVYVLCGGESAEHEVSLKSASAIINSLDRDIYDVYPIFITKEGIWCSRGLWDKKIENSEELIAISSDTITNSIGHFLINDYKDGEKSIILPALHGTRGEDGSIQGLLELIDIPYVGNEVLSSAVGMDKVVMHDLLYKHNIPQTRYTSAKIHHWKADEEKTYLETENKLHYPLYVKPANLGSSVGINRVENREELKEAFKEAFLYDTKIIIEEEVVAKEVQVVIIGNEDPKASLAGEFAMMEKTFFDYNAKYMDDKIVPVVPARLTPEIMDKIQKISIEIFKILNCYGLARIDIFLTDDNQLFVNEINTMPGFTTTSMAPALWEASEGSTYSKLIEKLIDLGFERYEQKKSIIRTRCIK